jgi:hypothetical protein
MNKIDEKINIRFNHPHNNEILHKHKSFNEEEDEYIQENHTLSFLAKEKKKKIEESSVGIIDWTVLHRPINNIGVSRCAAFFGETIFSEKLKKRVPTSKLGRKKYAAFSI